MRFPDLRPLYALLKREPATPDLGDRFITLLRQIVPSRRQLRRLTLYLISAQTRPGLDAPLINLVPYYFLSTPEWSRVPTPTLLEIIKRSQPGHEREWLLLCLPPHAIAPYASIISPIRWIARYIQINAHRDIDVATLIALGYKHSWPHDSWCSVLMRALVTLDRDDEGQLCSTWITNAQMAILMQTVPPQRIEDFILARNWSPRLLPLQVEFCSRYFDVFPLFSIFSVEHHLIWDYADNLLSWSEHARTWVREPVVIQRVRMRGDEFAMILWDQMLIVAHRVLAAVACLGDDLIRVRAANGTARFFRILQQLPPEMVGEILHQLFGYNHAGPVHDAAIAWALSVAE